MKILISGGSGQLGSDCTLLLSKTHEVITPDEKDLDIGNLEKVLYMVSAVSPDILLNCAAFTNVDACETEKEEAWRVNADGPGNLAKAADKYGSKLVHISTDYVFNGRKEIPEPYAEDDETEPLSYYGRTKLEGELIVKKITANHLIIRTAWVYGINGHNFLKTMLKVVLKNPGKEIKVVNDQFGSPTWSYSLSQQIRKLIEVNAIGTYHASSEGHCSWYELTRYFLENMGVENNVVPCASKDFPVKAVRPVNSILENRRLKEEGICVMPGWQDGIDEFTGKFGERLMREVRGSDK